MAKTVAITGINGGIGRALAGEFARHGFTVIGLDLAVSGPAGMEYYALDVTDEAKALTVYQDIAQKHELSHWVNNAGIAVLGPFTEVSAGDFDKVMKVNFHAVVHATRFWTKHFSQTGGCVVNIASAAGFVPSGDMTSYIASKHAVVGFTRALQLELELAKSLASTCLVAPGFVKTDIMQVGTQYGLPEKLQGLASTPESCAEEIVRAVLRGEREVIPTLSGKLMTGFYRYLPFGAELARKAYQHSRQIKK